MHTVNYTKQLLGCLLLSCLITSCNNNSSAPPTTESAAGDSAAAVLKEQTLTVNTDGDTLICYVAYNDSIKGKRPAVLVIPEWWGMTEYPRKRARMLAKLGYVGMAVDMYGNGRVADSPSTAMVYSGPFYKDP